MNYNIDVSNLKTLEDFFAGLASQDQRKILMTSYRKAVRPLVEAAKANVPKSPMMGVYRSLGTEEIPGDVAILVGSKINTKTTVSERGRTWTTKVWYAHLLELGSWKTGVRHWKGYRKIKRGVYKGQYKGVSEGMGHKSTGRMPASHFFENAYNQTEDRVFSIAADEWYKSIEQYIIKTNKKGR